MDSLDLHIKHSETQFKEIRSDLKKIYTRLNDLRSFKTEMITSAKWISFIISGATGVFIILMTWAQKWSS